MRNDLLETSRVHFESHILKHKMNIEVMLNNPIAIPEHTDIMDAIEKELAIMAEYDDKLEMLKKYFLK
jgi:hypothetical protein